MILSNKLENDLCKIVTKSQDVTKCNVTKSRLHCIRFCPLHFFTFEEKSGFKIVCCTEVFLTGLPKIFSKMDIKY